MLYLIICVPIPARTGSKRFPDTPGPDHIPPGSWAVNVTFESLMHKSFTGVIVASGLAATVIVILSESLQLAFIILYLMMWLPTPAAAGSNVSPVIPGHVNVPPGSCAVNVITGPSAHRVFTGVIVASGDGSIVIVI